MENYSAVPSQFVIGDTLAIEIAEVVYPAPTYSLELTFISPTAKLSATSTASGVNHLLTIDTSTLAPGRYDYQLKAIGTGFRKTIKSGITTAKQDFSAESLTTLDNRDWLEVAIDAIEASLAGRASKTQLIREFDGVRIQDMTLDEQIEALQKLKRMRAAKAGKWKQTIKSRFYN